MSKNYLNLIKKIMIVLSTVLLLSLIGIIFPENKVNAESGIVTNYFLSGEYIIKIDAETTVETFLQNVAKSGTEELKIYSGNVEAELTEYIKTGMQLKVGEKSYTLIVRGDIYPDGKLTAVDLSQLKSYYVGLRELSDSSVKAGDVNYTGTITVLDVSQLRMLLVGLELEEFETSEGNIMITQTPEEATKEVTIKVSVRENADVEYDKIFISLDGGETFQLYTQEIKLNENMQLKVKLTQNISYIDYEMKVSDEDLPIQNVNESFEEYMERLVLLGYAEEKLVTEDVMVEEKIYIINNIDSIPPKTFEFTIEETTNSITITAETRDTMKDYMGNLLADGIAGVQRYEYRINNGEWQTDNIFTNLTKNTEYIVDVRAIDYAGNITNATNNGLKVKTDDIVIAHSSITFEYDNQTMTKEDIIVAIESDKIAETGFKIQYQINGTNGEWIDGEICTVTQNCIIYARIVDSTNQEGVGEYASVQITNIDKLPPLTFTPEIIEETNTNIKVQVNVQDATATEENASSGIDSYKYHIVSTSGNEIISEWQTGNQYNFTGIDLENTGYYIFVEAKDNVGNVTVSEGISIGQLPDEGLGIDTINPGPENVTINNGAFRYFNPVIPVGFKAINTSDASWEGVMPRDWNKGLVIEDINGNQFVWVPVDGTNVKYQKGTMVWDFGNSAEWSKLTGQIKGDELPTTLVTLNEQEKSQIEKYEGFYVSRYEMGNDEGVLGSKEGLKVVNGVTYQESKTYAESMYKLQNVKSGLLTGTMWDTMTKWIANEKGTTYVTNNKNAGNTYETAFTFSGTYATGPNNSLEKRSEYKTGTNVSKKAKTRTLLTTGIVDNFKVKNIYDTAGNVWEYTSEYLINEYNKKQYIARGGNYYWQYDKVVAAGTALREFISQMEGEQRNEGGFRIALYLVEGTAQIGVYEDFNRTIDGKSPTYQNPVIPAGFAAVNKGADWGNGKTSFPDWNNGLVIEDINGNEFVWVPVDKTDVKYEKWTNIGLSYEETTGDDIASILTTFKEEEKTQIDKYGGFYIARYEASISDDGKVQTLPNKDVVVSKTYTDIKQLSEKMEIKEKNKKYVGTGLITGTQWDTVMKWIANEKGVEKVVRDSKELGTYGESIAKSGVTKVKNIYDMAGNVWEVTAEKYGEGERIYRGGVHSDDTVPVAYRGSKSTYYGDGATGFRIVLYVTGEVKSKISTVPVKEDVALNGTRGSLPIPSANGNVTITPSTTSWTNKNITVTIKNKNSNYYLEYQNSTSGTWTRGNSTTTLTISSNCTIYARLTNSKKQAGATTNYKVTNIDKVSPNSFRPTITDVTHSSITIKASTSDNLSGVATYKYYINDLLVYSGTKTSYVKTGLSPETEYRVYVTAVDKAGNTRTSSSIIDYTDAEPVPPDEDGDSSDGGSGGGSDGGSDGGTDGGSDGGSSSGSDTVTTTNSELKTVAKVGDWVNYSVKVAGITYDKWRILHLDRYGQVEIICYNGPQYSMGAGNNSRDSR